MFQLINNSINWIFNSPQPYVRILTFPGLDMTENNRYIPSTLK